jgi:hypothetical protein
MLDLTYTGPEDGDIRQWPVTGLAWVRNRVIERSCRT